MTLIIPITFIIFTILIAGIGTALFIFNQTRQGWWLGFGVLCSAFGSFAYGMELLSPQLGAKFLWVIVRYASLSVFVFASTRSVLFILRIPSKISSWVLLIGGVIPVTSIILLAMYPSSHLMYEQVWLDSSGVIPVLKKTVGPFYWIDQIYLMALLFVSIGMVLDLARREAGLIRTQAYIIAAGLGLPVLSNFLYLLNVRPWGFLNISLFSYFPAAVLLWYGVQRYHLASIRPIASALLLEQMQDGILVTDQTGMLVESNPAARVYLNLGIKDPVGRSLQEAAPEVAEAVLAIRTQQDGERVICLNGVWLQVSTSSLLMRDGEKAGDLTIIRDVNARVEADQLKEKENNRQSAWQERRKIARTLHDSITQYLNSLILLSASATKRLERSDYEHLAAILVNIEDGSRLAMQEMRVLINELQLETPTEQVFDLVRALNTRIEMIVAQAELQINFDAPKSIRLDSGRQHEIFYILIEALNNILQHAGADKVSITLWQSESNINVEVVDNGHGFDISQPRPGGMGLANMRQRTLQLGGQLTITSTPGEGACLSLQVPTRRWSERRANPG